MINIYPGFVSFWSLLQFVESICFGNQHQFIVALRRAQGFVISVNKVVLGFTRCKYFWGCFWSCLMHWWRNCCNLCNSQAHPNDQNHLQKNFIPDCPLCISQAHHDDPDHLQMVLFTCKKLWHLTVPFATWWQAEVKKLGQKARSGMVQYEILMYKCISFI